MIRSLSASEAFRIPSAHANTGSDPGQRIRNPAIPAGFGNRETESFVSGFRNSGIHFCLKNHPDGTFAGPIRRRCFLFIREILSRFKGAGPSNLKWLAAENIGNFSRGELENSFRLKKEFERYKNGRMRLSSSRRPPYRNHMTEFFEDVYRERYSAGEVPTIRLNAL